MSKKPVKTVQPVVDQSNPELKVKGGDTNVVNNLAA